ncbi:MAG: hypothetical protein E7480_06555 [Ruminococcaceae bacterium]|nr:hypothetical protein [Oscillospiraceae bacterium]
MANEDFTAKFIKEIKEKNGNSIKEIEKAFGGNSSGISSLLKDEQALQQLLSKLSENDLNKIKQLFDNPALLKMILNSEKGKNIFQGIIKDNK